MQKLRKLSTELGSPGVEALFKAARKAGLDVTKADVKQVVRNSASKQVFGRIQPSDGKTVSRTPTDSWQMDLADFSNSPAEYKGTVYKFFLIVINTFDRVVYTRALKSKDPVEVKNNLSQIIEEAPTKPKVISSDNGAEMQNQVSTFLESMGIVQRFKAVLDKNAISVVDKAIQSIKQITAKMMAEEGTNNWAAVLPKATAAYNKTPKEPLHGDAPYRSAR